MFDILRKILFLKITRITTLRLLQEKIIANYHPKNYYAYTI